MKGRDFIDKDAGNVKLKLFKKGTQLMNGSGTNLGRRMVIS